MLKLIKKKLKAFILISSLLLISGLFVGCTRSNVYDNTKSSVKSTVETTEEGTTLYTYVEDVLIPEGGEVSEGEYIGHLYHDSDFPDISASIMTSDIRDYDNDGEDELLVLRFKKNQSYEIGSSDGEYNAVSLSMYEEEDGDVILKEEYNALCPVFGYVGAYEISGIFLVESEGQIYICGSEFHDAYGYGDGIDYNSFILTYVDDGFNQIINTGFYSGSDFSIIDDYESDAIKMADFLDEIGLENESQHIRTNFDRYFYFNDSEEEILMMVVGELDGELEYYSDDGNYLDMDKDVIYTLSYSKIMEYNDSDSVNEYLCSFSSTSLLTDADMQKLEYSDYGDLPSGKSLAQMIINEIYAKHGYIFNSSEIQQYFNGKSWYQAESSDMEEIQRKFNTIEKANVEYLTDYLENANRVADNETSDETMADIFEILPSEFEYCSGAGAWRTDIIINDDGTFSGQYSDSNAGEVNICDFHGKFSVTGQVSKYIYTMELDYLETEGEVGTEYMKDGILYIYSDAHGFENADEFFLYLPGCPYEETEETISQKWQSDTQDYIPEGTYIIYNVGGDAWFVGCDD